MKKFGIISIVFGSLSALGALTAGHNPRKGKFQEGNRHRRKQERQPGIMTC